MSIFNYLNFNLLNSRSLSYGEEALNLGTPSKSVIIFIACCTRLPR